MSSMYLVPAAKPFLSICKQNTDLINGTALSTPAPQPRAACDQNRVMAFSSFVLKDDSRPKLKQMLLKAWVASSIWHELAVTKIFAVNE